MSSNPDNQNRQAVHNQHHDRHHERHDPIDEQVGFGEVLVGSVEPFFFGFFSAECPNHGQPRQNFTGNQVHTVNQCLHLLEFRHGDGHQNADNAQNDQHG